MDAVLKNLGDERIERVSESEPGWLKTFRLNSLELFKKLPTEKSELFKQYVNLEGIKWESLDFSDSGKEIPQDFDFILSKSSNRVVCRNSRIIETAKNDGVVLLDIKSAIGRHPEICKEYFLNKILKPEESKFVAFNSAFFDSGFFLYVPDDKNVELPIRIVNVLTGSTIAQNVIIVGKNSKVTLVEEEYSKPENALVSGVTDMHIRENAELTIGCIHSSANTVQFINKKALLEKDARLLNSSGFFGGGLTISSLDSVLKGDGSSADDFEIIFGDGSQSFNVTSNLFHEGAGTNGKVMAKGVFAGKSKGLFKGMINIGKNAKNSRSYLSGHSILLGKDASSDAIPGLQIENNDVKATHSASVAQINDEQIFYLMSRGFSENDAKKFIVSGFFEPIIRQIPLKEVAIIIKGLFEIKWGREDFSKLNDAIERISSDEAESSKKDIFEGHYKYRQSSLEKKIDQEK